ncbi:MAG: hypothetical protein K6F57_01160 [Candidatus Saccharibacteria bacterium]|nr:hypothetical protein [Candidatus Saccharibacteria bacterium]
MADFTSKGYTVGRCIRSCYNSDLRLAQIPTDEIKSYLTAELSGCHKEYVEYVKDRPAEFDKQFFKDCIASHYYALEFEQNVFEWMKEDFIDEELVMCAMIRAVNMRCVDRRGECDDWFYSVYHRKPELLTYDMYVLGARCFASKLRNGKNRFLAITPEEYRTQEYYAALCTMNNSPVMEDIPTEVLTDDFLILLIDASPENVSCFTQEALERKVPMVGIKYWQVVIRLNGYLIREIPLNDERVEFFLSVYGKDSSEYDIGFKRRYKEYLRKKSDAKAPSDRSTHLAAMTALAGAFSGISTDDVVDLGNNVAQATTNRTTGLPIQYYGLVPEEFAKQYDKEEYLLKIYEKLGIQVLGKRDYFYYSVVLPEEATVTDDGYGSYRLEINGEPKISYIDRGSFYDRSVHVTDIRCAL